MAAGRVLSEQEKTNITPTIEKKKKNLDKLVNLPSISGKVMVQIFPDTFSKHAADDCHKASQLHTGLY